MPDHMHLMFWGLRDDSNLYLAMKFLKKHTAQALLPALYQKQTYDHVLRDEETGRAEFEETCFYIGDNPVRAELCEHSSDYPFVGSIMAGYPDLKIHHPHYWDLFWRLVEQAST